VEKKSCPGCGGMYTPLTDGGLRAHGPVGSRCPQVSDPAPTVEETTTQGDDVTTEDNHSQADPEKGPWFGAMYVGKCGSCEDPISEGDRIRADGTGGYECGACGDSPATVVPDRAPTADDWQAQASGTAKVGTCGHSYPPPGPCGCGKDWQAQARAAARRHVALTADDGHHSPMSADDLFEDPTPHTPPKPVMSVSGQPKEVLRDHLGRYAVVLPGESELERYRSSGKPVGRTRATTFNKSATDKKNINDWGKRNVLIGASRRRDLVLQATGLTHEDDKDKLNALVVQLEETAGSKVGSDLGTYLHEFTEYMDAGLKTWQDAPQEFQRSLALYADALGKAGLEPIRSLIERTTIIREYGWVCGTFDRIFFHRPSGRYLIGDLKTGKTMDYGKNEVECQLWTYAHGVNQNGVYDWNTQTWVTDWQSLHGGRWHPEVSESVGVVIHMPVQGPKEGTVELLWADLESGRAHAEVCAAVRARPQGRMKPWGDGPAPLAPAPKIIDWSKVDPTPWTVLFSQARTSAEASELWKRAKEAGKAGVELNELVRLAQDSIRRHSVKG